MNRACGDCQLCCKLVPVHSLNKHAGVACKFQKFHKGCTVYRTPEMPPECGLWNCRWLVNDDAGELSRPDRAHYVIDLMPDFITVHNDDTGHEDHIQVVQIWVDPKYPRAHHDPALRRWMERRARDNIACIIRFNETDAVVVFAPPFDAGGEWHEIAAGMRSGPQHSPAELEAALGEMKMVIE